MCGKYDYIDVDNLEELPILDSKMRYLEFLGGIKTYRCFIVNKDLPRCDFYKNNLELIEPFLHPVYQNRGILVAQDNTFALPGFYIISYDKKYNSVADLPESLSIRTSYLIKQIIKIMKESLNVKYVNIYYEEKNTKSNNVHFWIMPKVNKEQLSEKLYDLNMKEYLYSFKLEETKSKIIEYNKIVQQELKIINYKKKDDELYNLYEPIEKKINLCISKHCFIKCKGCYNNFCHSKDISYKKVVDFLEYAKRNGLIKVTLSGGDPLAREDITKIIKKCFKLGLKVNLDTVGLTFINSSKIIGNKKTIKKFKNYKLLRKIDTIGIPIDGSNNDNITKFRISKDDLFDNQIKILELFERKKINVCVNTVYHKQNKNDMKKIYNILKKYSCVKKWQVFQYMPIGPLGKKNENEFCVNLIDFEKDARYFLRQKDKKFDIEFKCAKERAYNYMLVNSSGVAYKVDLKNNTEIFGNIDDKKTWSNILKNLF